jgi:hypothetical protein
MARLSSVKMNARVKARKQMMKLHPNLDWSNLVIHHIDLDSMNNNIENLQILTPKQHVDLHKKQRPIKRRLYNDDKDIIVKGINEQIHYQFALMCKRLRTTMKQRLVDLITKDLNDNKEVIK